MKWLVTSDWQSAFSNLEFSKQAHKQELQIIRKHNIQGFVDNGDLKDAYNLGRN